MAIIHGDDIINDIKFLADVSNAERMAREEGVLLLGTYETHNRTASLRGFRLLDDPIRDLLRPLLVRSGSISESVQMYLYSEGHALELLQNMGLEIEIEHNLPDEYHIQEWLQVPREAWGEASRYVQNQMQKHPSTTFNQKIQGDKNPLAYIQFNDANRVDPDELSNWIAEYRLMQDRFTATPR